MYSSLGKIIQPCNQTRFEVENYQSFGFPKLNTSQCKAIREALNNEFTLIQGPPGKRLKMTVINNTTFYTFIMF